ncbi:DNA topoisomerase 2-binding protein 1-A isoform X1 [Senna tora]|uniref:DNA topoisomerase 2-binding protein 1-A isoform X1 n=1 Tax=Senna tora TaxID=362788 RepID=A0A834T9N2_9FABA|nr:DNA topoisomerase 2-binding protein 1-A isoform X1 [Senna tora]
MLRTNTFKGANVFMSRNLVPPEVFDALHDALKNNGAHVELCCDPSRNGPNDYHIISHDHEKLEDLKAKGCNLLGPQCVLSCAKEQRLLPKQGFTCCLAMDGVKVLASGFDMDEKVKIGELVTSMGGVLHTKASLDVNFVIVKNVLAAKYKFALPGMLLARTSDLVLFQDSFHFCMLNCWWALNIVKKPIVTFNWLKQCTIEHRVVPQESYRVLPFSGLTISVTRIPAVTSIILPQASCVASPEGDKYKVAKRWGHIYIVTKKWFDQSIARRACLNEESYPVQNGSVSSHKTSTDYLAVQHSQEKEMGKLQPAASCGAPDSYMPVVSGAEFEDRNPEATQSEIISSGVSYAPISVKETDPEPPPVQPCDEPNLDGAVANDSESDDNDLYLSECRILLVGFEASEMRKLVNMVRKGGGSRYMSLNDKLTHIVIGTPSETEKKEVRSLAAFGVIHVVKTTWLEECDREKKEVLVLRRHIAQDLLLPKGSTYFSKGAVTGIMGKNQVVIPLSSENKKGKKLETGVNDQTFLKSMGRSIQQSQLPVVNNKMKGQQKMQQDSISQCLKSSTIFRGLIFCFSNSFPEERRDEIVQWINQGGGEVVNGHKNQNAHYTIECHGVTPVLEDMSQTKKVSSHWIRSCLEDDSLLDVGCHILYSPLPCHIPLPGFESFRFCVSQYEEKDRILLRNLCFVLGAKFVEKLTKKVTHLLCKFVNGPKYEAACKWGIQSVTSEWIFECVKQNKIVAVDEFLPKEVTAQDQEAGIFTVSQFPTQAAQILSGENSSQFSSRSQNLRNTPKHICSRVDNHEVDAKISSIYSKKARLLEEPDLYDMVPSAVDSVTHIYDPISAGDNMLKDNNEVPQAVPDVAAAIEDLLEQTSKVISADIFSLKSPGKTETEQSVSLKIDFLIRLSSRNENNDDASPRAGIYDNFSETQTESQVVGYEEDLSGRQMLIDRVRTRSSMA